jgi:hypothetical protein
MSPTRADMVLEIGQGFGGRLVVGGQDLGGDLRIAEAIEERDALGWPQHHIERRDAPVAMRSAEQLASVGVAAVEHPDERLGAGDAFLVEGLGAAAEPAAW